MPAVGVHKTLSNTTSCYYTPPYISGRFAIGAAVSQDAGSIPAGGLKHSGVTGVGSSSGS